jgi:FtsZ-binding cell division protein ZapB
MGKEKEIDQFKLLEEKIDSLIKFVKSLKKEKESLIEKRHIQEETISVLTKEMESLRATNDTAKRRIISLLEKIEQLGI